MMSKMTYGYIEVEGSYKVKFKTFKGHGVLLQAATQINSASNLEKD